MFSCASSKHILKNTTLPKPCMYNKNAKIEYGIFAASHTEIAAVSKWNVKFIYYIMLYNV